MEKEDIIEGIKTFCTKIDGFAKKGYYATQGRTSLIAMITQSTTANRVWVQSEYIIAFMDDKDSPQPISEYLKGFKKIVKSNYHEHPQYLILQEDEDNWGVYDGSLAKIGDTNFIADFLAKKQYIQDMLSKGYPMQKIFYGSPGCGKSYYIEDFFAKEHIPEEQVVRTTFHPDSDYNSFVGAYKPKMNGKDIEYKFSPQAFTKAYIKAYSEPTKQIFLVIEEINRGNCAQIFGDIFQLLDRTDGVSTYAIDADEDLRDFLEKELPADKQDGILNGKLRLPSNLNILATMNTSDQSLFPMDSAFKRRWDWVYMPIDTTNTKSAMFDIVIKDTSNKVYTYSWHKFLEQINPLIKDVTKSEDKQLGTFFIKESITTKDFISKVMFFLWYEVCKDEFNTKNNFFRTSVDKEFSFTDLYSGKGVDLLVSFMEKWEVTPKKVEEPSE